jgi:hypothetical protein
LAPQVDAGHKKGASRQSVLAMADGHGMLSRESACLSPYPKRTHCGFQAIFDEKGAARARQAAPCG